MDGIFGYQVVTKIKSNGESKTSFVKKNFLDWVYDVVFKLEKMPQTRVKTIAAFKQIAEQIKGADDGQFNALIETYADNNDPIDYEKIREVLRTSLEPHPPRIYSRPVSISNGNKSGIDAAVTHFKKLYLQNIRKSVCREEDNVEIFREGPSGQVSDENLAALSISMFHHFKSGGKEVSIVEPDFIVATRMELKQYETLSSLGTQYGPKYSLRMEILKFRLEMKNAYPTMPVEQVKAESKKAFAASKEHLRKLTAS
nr:hypothetical protein [uncultured Noviherbaspirillum sp.]